MHLHLLQIVDAAIRAVAPENLVARRLAVVADQLLLDGVPLTEPLKLGSRGRVVIVGGGKAAAGMAAGVAAMLSCSGVPTDRVSGLVSVPEGCGRFVPGVEIRETRPPAENLPTPAVVGATREMLLLLESLDPRDLVVALVTGGGSALLAAPRPGVPLDEKIAVAKFLMAAATDITEINLVRRAGSAVKGGGLARACAAKRMLVLVLSDVIGDPLESIASGPCIPAQARPAEALEVLERTGVIAANIAPRLVTLLRDDIGREAAMPGSVPYASNGSWTTQRGCRVDHVLLGSNATAVEAAAAAATGLGYAVTVRQATPGPAETADEVGRRLAREGSALASATAADGRPRALIEGGEAVVRLPSGHGRGGRNQQTALAALANVLGSGRSWPRELVLASIGTDGEDGPTNAAGGFVDGYVAARIKDLGSDVAAAVARCDAFSLLEVAHGLIVTGPTGTNVADVRVLLASTNRDD